MKEFNKMVVGVFGNASFNGRVQVGGNIDRLPTAFSKGYINVNDSLVKEALIRRWNKNNEKIFFLDEENGVFFKNEYERYNYLFSASLNKRTKPRLDVLMNLVKFIDVRTFGLNGYTNFNGFNFDGAVIFCLGKDVYVDGMDRKECIHYDTFNLKEAYYAFDFCAKGSKNPYVNDELEYFEEDYNTFKETLLETKYSEEDNVEKAFVIFVEGKDRNLSLGNLSPYISINKDNTDKRILIIDKLIKHCNKVRDEIEKIEIYYNPSILQVETPDNNSIGYNIHFLPLKN